MKYEVYEHDDGEKRLDKATLKISKDGHSFNQTQHVYQK